MAPRREQAVSGTSLSRQCQGLVSPRWRIKGQANESCVAHEAERGKTWTIMHHCKCRSASDKTRLLKVHIWCTDLDKPLEGCILLLPPLCRLRLRATSSGLCGVLFPFASENPQGVLLSRELTKSQKQEPLPKSH